jgi:hypothetical protein
MFLNSILIHVKIRLVCFDMTHYCGNTGDISCFASVFFCPVGQHAIINQQNTIPEVQTSTISEIRQGIEGRQINQLI